MVIDLVIYLTGVAGLAGYLALVARASRRRRALVPALDVVSVRARLAADHRERVSRPDVSALRHGDARLDRPGCLSLEQRARIARVEERKRKP